MSKPTAPDPLWIATIRKALSAEAHHPKHHHGISTWAHAIVGTAHHQMLLAMADAGLMEPGPKTNKGAEQYFQATFAACELIGLHKAAILRYKKVVKLRKNNAPRP